MKYTSISLFDLDKTLLKENSSYLFGAYLYQKKKMSSITVAFNLSCYFLHACGFFPLKLLHHLIFNYSFKNCPMQEYAQLAKEFFHENYSKLFVESVFKRLQRAQEAGHFTAILSSSPDFIVQPIAALFNVNAFQATQYAVNTKGYFENILNVMDGTSKASYLMQISNELSVKKENIFAYSDSVLDLPLLKIAGHAVGVNPDGKLKKICLKKQWEIIN